MWAGSLRVLLVIPFRWRGRVLWRFLVGIILVIVILVFYGKFDWENMSKVASLIAMISGEGDIF